MPTRQSGRQAALADLARRMLADIDGLVDRMGEAYRREIPEYAALTSGELASQVLPMSRHAVTAFFSGIVETGTVGPRELSVFEDSGRARLGMGIPLDSVLHAYRLAGRVTWDAVVATIRPGEETLLGDLAGGWIEFIDRASCVVARGYVAASHERMRHVDARRRELLEALLSATDHAEVAAVSLRFSTALASAYVPVVLAGAGIAGRIDALLDVAPPGTLGGHRAERVLLLVPERLADPAALCSAAQGLVAYGEAKAPGPNLFAEVQHVETLADLAGNEHGNVGVFGPDDLLVQQLLLANGRAAAALRRRVNDALAQRDPSGALTATLGSYLSCGSVPETARLERVHPNTVGYRLARVREVTNLDPRVPRDAALLVLGLGLRRELVDVTPGYRWSTTPTAPATVR